MTVLSIDTSNYPLGVALVNEQKVIGEFITNIKKNHSVRAMPAVEQLMKDCDIQVDQLTKIVVAEGPGSYTGVRIGVTIAKTIAWSKNIPLVGVSSLEALAANGQYFNGYICPLFDARRGQVYTGLYEYEKEMKTILPDENILLSDWLQKVKVLNRPVLFIGNDVSLHRNMIKETLGEQAVLADQTAHNPRPSKLAMLGMNREPVDVHHFVPNYLRLVEAEAKWLEQQNVSK
ncbi:tRNA (adenosine(37)-N6)-threonylcarbamoyltransferase complex dimerization subunit type 1 TsaB [Bacillus sp. FJAT-47783]|uniref:tRNA (adenosine(37)-N6)-threonylcarbamoyltransferase complex dimerization subunit type 1 TsaB n=1 Tax=Bacillus sp. FJAT-47783 TaxID=2922712 RepID=UPI001FACD5B7|nr:tRNA (adenosine(37)-N6)-threonylcarbamoyltransferase complex dimerization subunit type 1 TsaB [Bacillus sp. FJAT-47783]